MQHLRITATLDPTLIPPMYSMVDESEAIVETRVIDWNLAADDVGTFLYAIDGDATDSVTEHSRPAASTASLSLSRTGQATSYALISARPAAIPLFTTFMSVTARAGSECNPVPAVRTGEPDFLVAVEALPVLHEQRGWKTATVHASSSQGSRKTLPNVGEYTALTD